MSVTELRHTDHGGAVSGGAMDRVVAVKRIDRRILIAGAAAVLILILLVFWLFAPRADSQTLPRDRLTISAVEQGVFEDFLPMRARVAPLVTVYLDAVEGGRVEQMLVEDGAQVTRGQLLAVLSNADLQLSTLARQTEVEQQLNNMRSQELALAQTRSANQRDINQAQTDLAKARRQYDIHKPLAERGFVSGKVFRDSSDDLSYQTKRMEILRRSVAQDEALQASQLKQLRASAQSLNSGLAIARGSLGQLNLRAPVSGQLSGFSIQLGQSVQQGERIGQIDSAGRSKLEADVDEYYLGRVSVGQSAAAEVEGKSYRLRVAKVYPQVRNGQFRVDLTFIGAEPGSIQRGQTLQARLTLGDSTRAVLIPDGAFYNDSGGNYVFVVDKDGNGATKRSVQLGRRNAEYIEVISGLKPGEKVITSSYAGLTDKNDLSFSDDE